MPVASPIDWLKVENGLSDWVETATGISTIWSDAGAPQPPYPYAVLNVIGGPDPAGAPGSARRSVDSDGNLLLTTVHQNEITVSVQINVGRDANGNAPGPEKHARNLLHRAQVGLSMERFCQALSASGLGTLDVGAINEFDLNINQEWVRRSQMDVTFMVKSEVTEPFDYVETVELSGTFPDADSSLSFTDDTIGPAP
jgi:hypothetical protein